MTTSVLVEDGVQCGELSVTHEKIAFCPGDDLYMYRFYGDISANDIGSVDLLDPNGDSYLNSPQLDTPDDMLPVYLTRRFRNNSPIVLPDIQGTWTMKVTLDGESYERAFEVTLDACSPSACGSMADCLMGQVCALGTCVTGNCTSDADCQDDQICLPGEWKCTAESGTAGGEAGTGGAGDESTRSASTAASTTAGPLPQPTSGGQPTETGEDPSRTSGPVDGDKWADWCRQPLLWLGRPDPVARLFEQLAHDPDAELLHRMLSGWHAAQGSVPMLIREVVRRAEMGDADFAEVLRDVADERGQINRRRLGWWLKRHLGRIVGGLKFERGNVARNAETWRVVSVSSVSSVYSGAGAKSVADDDEVFA